MATLTITINDSIIPRLRDAYGVATNAELKARIIADVKNRVVSHETNVAQEAERAKQDALRQTSNDAVVQAEARATSDIIIT
jgi:phage protein D